MKRIVICADGTWNEPEKLDEKTGRMYRKAVLKVAHVSRPHSAAGFVQMVRYRKGLRTADGSGNEMRDGAEPLRQ